MPGKGMGRLGILRRKNKCPTAPVLEGERPVHDTQGVGPQLPFQGIQRRTSQGMGCSGLLFLSYLLCSHAQPKYCEKSEFESKSW